MTAHSPRKTSVNDVFRTVQLADAEVVFYRKEGYLLVSDVVPAEHAADLRAEVLDIMRIVGLGSVKLRQTRQYVAGGWVDALINSPNLLAMASRLVGGPATLHSPFTAVKGPGGGEFHWHQDNQYTRFDGPGINVWIALENMTPENGCLVIAPRSHVYGTLSQVPNPDGDRYHTIEKTPEYFLPVRMRAGDCVAFDRLTVHASLPNQTSAPRVAYAVQFFRNDVNALHEDGQWRSLKDYPRIDPRPVPEIRPE